MLTYTAVDFDKAKSLVLLQQKDVMIWLWGLDERKSLVMARSGSPSEPFLEALSKALCETFSESLS